MASSNDHHGRHCSVIANAQNLIRAAQRLPMSPSKPGTSCRALGYARAVIRIGEGLMGLPHHRTSGGIANPIVREPVLFLGIAEEAA